MKAVVATGHSLFRDVLADILRTSVSKSVVIVADSYPEALRSIDMGATDLVLIDLSLPGLTGLAGIVDLVNQAGPARVVVLADGHPPAVHRQARICGVAGLIEKTSHPDQVHRTISMVLRGGLGFPDTMAIPVHPSAVPQQTVLTTKQLRVLSLLTRGKSNKQIAKELELSPNTVKAHVSEILPRLGVSTRAEAIVLAHEPLAPQAMEPVPA